jgi:protein arginine N-methyltransferase 1
MTIEHVAYPWSGGRVAVAVDNSPGYGSSPDLWPSVGEYPLYDPFLYYSMSNDAVRNNAFRHALVAASAGRRVLDIGTGQNLHWAMEAVRYGASRVVAIEAISQSHAAAARRLAEAPEADAIELIRGLSFDVDLAQRAEVCVAELIGSIASAEGMLAVMADAHARLLVPGAVVVPAACSTMVGAVSLRSLFPAGLAFSCDALPYLFKIFDLNGGPFDVRLAIANPDPTCVASTVEAMEVLRFDSPTALDAATEVRLEIKRDGSVDGLLCWIRLDAGGGAPVVDSLMDKTSWIPAYLPLFDNPVPVSVGDMLTVKFERRTSRDGVHPDYAIRAVMTAGGSLSTGSFLSAHYGRGLGTAAVYRELMDPAFSARTMVERTAR